MVLTNIALISCLCKVPGKPSMWILLINWVQSEVFFSGILSTSVEAMYNVKGKRCYSINWKWNSSVSVVGIYSVRLRLLYRSWEAVLIFAYHSSMINVRPWISNMHSSDLSTLALGNVRSQDVQPGLHMTWYGFQFILWVTSEVKPG